MPESEFQSYMKKIKDAKDQPELKTVWNEAMDKAKDKPTQKSLIGAKDDRLAELKAKR